jgi:predicted ATPase/DNA-binding winged helix-turn-helix (wHTH) protein
MMQPTKAFLFGGFCLVPDQRALLANGEDLNLSARAFDILLVLLERRDRVVLKDELLRLVWPGRVVEEGNLTVYIAGLRKLLGRGVIATFSGRGYRFVAPVDEVSSLPAENVDRQNSARHQEASERSQTNVPAAVSPLIGRDAAIADVRSLLEANRIVTLTGTGGIGKTRLALEVARGLSPDYADGAWIVELGSLAGGEFVPSAISSALRLDIAGRADPLNGMLRALGSKQRRLLVLDSCEHLIAAAASVVETMLGALPGLRVLATSREPLQIEGECQYQLAPLTVPEDGLPSDEVLRYTAVQLFMARANSAHQSFPASDSALQLVATICRRLDGIPLAIELGAAGATVMGLTALADRLDDRLAVLTRGNRSASARHQTLRAALDWSYELLTDVDRAVFRRLSIFAGSFGLDAALSVAAAEGLAPAQMLESVTGLVAKSLVASEMEDVATRYRLLETTRIYAAEKLDLSGEKDQTARRHAEFHCDLFERASVAWQTINADEWLSAYARYLDDVHSALDWACSSGRNAPIGAALTSAAMPLWLELSLIDEGLRRTERAIAALEDFPGRTERQAMLLQAALARLQLYSVTSFKECGDAWANALQLAEALGDTDYQLHVLWGGYAGFMTAGQFHEASNIAHRFREVSNASGRAEQLIGHRMIGNAVSRLGDQVSAREHTELMIENYVLPAGRHHLVMFGGDQLALARGTLARILWLQGYPDRAMSDIKQSVELIDQDLSVLSHRLIAFACPVALWTGNLEEAERYLGFLRDFTAERASEMRSHVDCIAGELRLAYGDAEGALSLLKPAVEALRKTGSVQHLTWQLSVTARALACAGQTVAALTALEEALARCDQSGEGWCRPELLRLEAEMELQAAETAEPAVHQGLNAALVQARQQGARSWELRIATSIARLSVREGHRSKALNILEPVFKGFTEGFGTPDLQAAADLLNDLA